MAQTSALPASILSEASRASCDTAEPADRGLFAAFVESGVFGGADTTARLLARTVPFASEPTAAAGARGDVVFALDALEPSAAINAVAAETGVAIPAALCAAFDSAWRLAVRDGFRGGSELEEWARTGTSNGWPLRLQVLAVPPNKCFKVHAHPNIEFELTLCGTLREVRLVSEPVPTTDFGVAGGTPTGDYGPNLAALAASGAAMRWAELEVPTGQTLVNAVGSTHQSFTTDEGALLLLLWSGCHANITPDKATGVSDLLKPGAGWATP